MRIVVRCLSCALLMSPLATAAQTVHVAEEIEPQVVKLLNVAGLSYLGGLVAQERGLADRLTVTYGLGLHYSFFDNSANPPIFGTRFINILEKSFGRPYSTQGLTPYLFAEIRSYNLARRAFRGRSIQANSANYVALVGEIPFASGVLINVPNLALAYPVGLKYGVRRALGPHIYAEGSLGGLAKIGGGQVAVQPRLDGAVAWYW